MMRDGIRCTVCAADRTEVIDSRPSRDGRSIRRRRQCAHGHRFTTWERAGARVAYSDRIAHCCNTVTAIRLMLRSLRIELHALREEAAKAAREDTAPHAS
jgi:transcriptional regulator NrdR family protein